jgi:hypothetical protein
MSNIKNTPTTVILPSICNVPIPPQIQGPHLPPTLTKIQSPSIPPTSGQPLPPRIGDKPK